MNKVQAINLSRERYFHFFSFKRYFILSITREQAHQLRREGEDCFTWTFYKDDKVLKVMQNV